MLSGRARRRRVENNVGTSGESFDEVVDMELTPSVISRVVHPTAAFAESPMYNTLIGSKAVPKQDKQVPVP